MNNSEQWQNQHRAFGALDWASEKHSVVVVDQAGKVIEAFEIEHSAGIGGRQNGRVQGEFSSAQVLKELPAQEGNGYRECVDSIGPGAGESPTSVGSDESDG